MKTAYDVDGYYTYTHTHTHAHRADNLAKLRSGKEFDVLVIGGGVTGVGVALDSQLRGGLVP